MLLKKPIFVFNLKESTDFGFYVFNQYSHLQQISRQYGFFYLFLYLTNNKITSL